MGQEKQITILIGLLFQVVKIKFELSEKRWVQRKCLRLSPIQKLTLTSFQALSVGCHQGCPCPLSPVEISPFSHSMKRDNMKRENEEGER